MAGLQYNFFPTDFFYPRPVQTTNPTPPPSTPLTQKREAADRDDDSKHPGPLVQRCNNRSSFSMRRKEGQMLGRIYIQNRGDQVKLPRNSVSWLMLIPDEEDQSESESFSS